MIINGARFNIHNNYCQKMFKKFAKSGIKMCGLGVYYLKKLNHYIFCYRRLIIKCITIFFLNVF